MKQNVELITLSGLDIRPYLPSMAKLQREVFRQFPYLYDEKLSNHIKNLSRYVECSQSIIILVLDGANVMGMTSGMPLTFDTEKFQKPFLDTGIDIKTVYYLGDSVLLPPYRGKKIYRQFFAKREAKATECDCTIGAFISVERSLSDPRCPDGYQPLNQVWKHFGYEKYPDLNIEMEWKDTGDKKPSPKTLVYWLKHLK